MRIRDGIKDVQEMHEKFGIPIDTCDFQRYQFRIDFLREEADEFVNANSLVDFIDALIDMNYIICGTFVEFPGMLLQIHKTKVEELPSPKRFFANSLLVDKEHRRSFVENVSYDNYNKIDYAQRIIRQFYKNHYVMDALNLEYIHHWRAVHDANMAKVIATPENPSTRGSTSGDLVKPEGWAAPDHETIIKTGYSTRGL